MANLLTPARSMSPAASGHSVIAVKKFQGLSVEKNNNKVVSFFCLIFSLQAFDS